MHLKIYEKSFENLFSSYIFLGAMFKIINFVRGKSEFKKTYKVDYDNTFGADEMCLGV